MSPAPFVQAVFQPDDGPVRAMLVAGACGNVGFGKVGQFARILGKHGVKVIALDLSDAVQEVPNRLREAFGRRFTKEQQDAILDNVVIVQGTVDDIPAEHRIGMVFEAIPERLDIKRPFYASVRARDPEAYIFSATSGITTKKLFEGLDGADRCGVLHPFFPHLTNKLFELPQKGAVTSKDTIKTIKKLLGGLGMNLLATADVPAFAADRLFCGMMLEAVRIHDSEGLSPAQVDDVCKKVLGTSPFYVHNLIQGANYLSAHCMELMQEEVDSTLYAIPEVWKPYTEDPKKQWPYERGEKCPPEKFQIVADRMLGMLLSLTAYMLEHDIVKADTLNFLGEKALAFRMGPPAIAQDIGFEEAQRLVKQFVEGQNITKGDEVAPVGALSADRPGWGELYVSTAVHDGVGLLSTKRTTINHVFVAELDAALTKLENDDGVKAIVVAPDGSLSREFGHGADPNCFVPVLGKYDDALGLIQGWKKTLSRFHGSQKPTVAALVGRVLGGGLEFASNCQVRIAAQGTALGQPEPVVGVVPGLGGCHLIHRQSEPSAATRINELLLTGDTFKVDEAAEWGFVHAVVPVRDLPMESMKLAAAIADGSVTPRAFRNEGLETNVNRDVAKQNQGGVVHDAELRELIASTVETANGASFEEGSKTEEEAAAKSLTLSSSKVGVKAMLRGKPPAFEHPLQ